MLLMVNIKDAPHPCGKSMRGNNQCPKRRSGTVVHADMSCCYQCSECLPLSSTWNTTNYCTVSSLMCNKVGDKMTHLAASSLQPGAGRQNNSVRLRRVTQVANGNTTCRINGSSRANQRGSTQPRSCWNSRFHLRWMKIFFQWQLNVHPVGQSWSGYFTFKCV